MTKTETSSLSQMRLAADSLVSPSYKWWVVAVLWFVCFFNYADRQAISAVFPKLKEEFGLKDEGYLNVAGRAITLTDKGTDRAASVVRKHRLAERLLTDIIGLDWHKAHLEAGRWEHVISDEVEARLIEILGHPATCPHGNPIPGSAQKSPPSVPPK